MTSLTLHDFELQIDAGDGTSYGVAVLRSPAGAARGVMTFPFDSEALAAQLAGLEQTLHDGSTDGDVELVQHFGAALFDALLQGDVRTAYDRSCQATGGADEGLRLKLRILAPELLTVPWEFLFDPRSRAFVALSRHTPVMRYLELLLPDPDFAVTPPLRILGIVSAPTDLAALNVAQEKARVAASLQEVTARGQVELVWLEQATWQALQEAMQQGPWHILHYSGHAFFDPRVGEGALAMTGQDGTAWLLSATQLGRLLADQRSLRLAVLSACEGARGDEQTPFSSTAAALVQHGLPAAVAMQYAISQDAAGAFVEQFYGALGDRLPVDAAVSEGRKAIDQAAPGTVEWGTPVLFSRAADGVIWQIATEEERHPERALLRRLLWPLVAIAVVVLGIAGSLAWPMLEPLWNVWPMTGNFNIAVADIGVIQPGGAMRESAFGEQISAELYHSLDDAYTQAIEAGTFDRNVLIWHDSLGRAEGKNITLGHVEGATPEDRMENAAKLAQRIQAQMVIFGHLTDATDPESLELEFYYDGQTRAGDPSALWGGYEFGAPIQPAVSYAVNPDSASLTMAEELVPRSRALLWMTQALSYALANLPEKGLAILQQAEPTADGWGPGEGKELFHLVLGEVAQKSREFDIAIAALEEALAIEPEYIPALIVLGGAYFDRGQLFPYRTQAVPAGLENCISLENIENSAKDLDAAIADTETAIGHLTRAVELADAQESPFAPRAHMVLGLAYRARATWQTLQNDLDGADATLADAQAELDRALAAFTPETDPVYYAWTQVGLGTVDRLRAHVAAIRRDRAEETAARAEAQQAQVGWLESALGHYDACIALSDRTAGNVLFQQRVLACSCRPFALEARQVLSSTLEVNP